MEDGWRVLYDGSGAKAIGDPGGATYTFCYIKNGKIVTRDVVEHSGFTYSQDARKKLSKMLKNKLEALEKPFVIEERQTTLKECK